MRVVRSHIAKRQLAFAAHPFFDWLATTDDRDQVVRMLSHLAFWVSSFQDVLAINEGKLTDPQLRDIARRHRKEDAGHDRWFFKDLHRLGMATLTAEELFARPRAPIRHAVFTIMSEVFRATHDLARITLLYALESASGVFFEHTANWADRVGAPADLEYFSRFHLEIELRHDLFERDAFLDAHELDEPRRAEHLAIVTRTFDAVVQMFDALMIHVAEPAERKVLRFTLATA